MVVGCKEKRDNTKEKRENRIEVRSKVPNKEIVRKKKPLKTFVVITTNSEDVFYAKVLAWARQGVKLTEEEMKSLSTKPVGDRGNPIRNQRRGQCANRGKAG